jgi:hypothetical protein
MTVDGHRTGDECGQPVVVNGVTGEQFASEEGREGGCTGRMSAVAGKSDIFVSPHNSTTQG